MMQILDVVIYSHQGDMEKISFLPNKVNLVIGPDNSGKSSIGRIIEYCLGADYNMPDDHMDERVSWYGIRIRLKNQEYFIARKHPRIPPTHISMYFKIGNPVQIPKRIDYPTTTKDTVFKRLSEQLGIMPGIEIPWPSFDNPTEASVTNTLPFCFQYQSEIQSDIFLFHSYFGEFTRTITKHILPYLLGAIPNTIVKQRYKLIKLEREIKSLQKQLQELIIMKKGGSRLTNNLIIEAKQLMILSEIDIENIGNEMESLLQLIANWTPMKTRPDLENNLISLQDRAIDLRGQLNKLDKQIYVVKQFRDEYIDQKTRLTHQESHLKPIDLFVKLNGESKKCPICSNDLKLDYGIADEIKLSVLELKNKLESISEQTISASSIVEKLEQERMILTQKMLDNYVEISTLLDKDKRNKQNFDDDMNRARVAAKSEFMLNIMNKEENVDLKQEMLDKEFLRNEISKEVNLVTIDNHIERIQNTINQLINEKTKKTNLQIRNKFIEFDVKRQRFWKHENDETTVLRVSGESWLWTHMITMMSFQEFFNEHKRPVPNFLFLDQPSQIYYSSESEDYDELKTNNLFNFIFDIEKDEFAQFIIVDHAKLTRNKEFSNHIRRTFTEKDKFVPENWPIL